MSSWHLHLGEVLLICKGRFTVDITSLFMMLMFKSTCIAYISVLVLGFKWCFVEVVSSFIIEARFVFLLFCFVWACFVKCFLVLLLVS